MNEKIESFSCQTNIDGENYVYKYFLLQSVKKISTEDGEIDVPCYGIEILREKIVDEKIVETYSEDIKHISPYKDKVLNLLRFLKDHEVSPVHLVDITGEWVDEWVEDFEYEISGSPKRLAYI